MSRVLKENWMWWLAILALGLLPFTSVISSGQVLFASDQIGSFSWKFYFEALRHGELPLWNPYALGGMPTFDAMFGDASYPIFMLLGMLLPATLVVSCNFILHTLIAGFTSFLLARRFFKLSPVLSLALACAYMLNTNFISHIHAGHTGKFHIMAWLPLSLYCLLRSLQPGSRWFHLMGLALTITLFVLTSHLQFTYYVLMGYFLYWAFKTVGIVRSKRLGLAAWTGVKFWGPVLLGVGLAFPIFYPPTQYNKEFSVRSEGSRQTFEHATSWSMHPEEAASLLVPEFTGINENYWGRNPFKLNSEYAGMAILFLAIFGLALFRHRWQWFWLGVGGLALIFALGAHTPLFYAFYSLVPGVKSFRAPGMILFWLITALWMMTAQTLSLLQDPAKKPAPEKKAKAEKWLLILGLGGAGLMVLAGIAPAAFYGIWNGFISAENLPNFARQEGNHAAFAAGALKNGVLLGLLVLGLRAWVLRADHMPRFAALLLAVVCADLYWANRAFISGYEPNRFLPKDAVLSMLAAEEKASPFRVFGIPGSYERGALQYYQIEAADGFQDNEYRVYRTYRGDYQQNPNLMAGLKQNPDGSVSGNVFLDMLNVKYIVYRPPQDGILRTAENKSVLPRAYFVTGWETDADSLILDRMKGADFNPLSSAFVSSSTPVPAGPSGADAEDTARTESSLVAKSRSFNRLEYSVKNSRSGLMVLSELYFPHWKLWVDGAPVPLLRVNYAFRGVYLPAGSHEVRMEYRSPWLAKGKMVSGVSLLLLVLLAAGCALPESALRKSKAGAGGPAGDGESSGPR